MKISMKKILLATAAVLAVSATSAQAEIKLDLGGYFKGYAGYSNQDADNLREFDIKRKSQVYFDGETTLDNGLTVGYHGELFQEVGDPQLEESYLYFSGNWGRFNLGRSNNAAYLLQVAAPGADSNIDGQDISFSFYNPNSPSIHQDYKQVGFEGANSVAGYQYTDKITYLTPKFNGFQAGVSYSPENDTKNVNSGTTGMSGDKDFADYEDAWDAGLRYDGEFSGVGIHVGGGYSINSREVDVVGVTDDQKEWNVGAKFTYAGFGIGAAYNHDNNGLAGDNDIVDWTAGVDYTWGAYVFGASYFNSDRDNTLTGAELDRYAAGASYTFGPGMQFRGAIAYYDESAKGTLVDDNDATVVTVGTDIQF